ncbi:MAG: hypothetical protein MPJ24_08865 [Pirellulaceae bacterium]|nr:hypothetical protein [Pirellulaceae bacterium]
MRRVLSSLACLLFVAVSLLTPQQVSAQREGNLPQSWADSIHWRSIGPASMGGRVTRIAVSPANYDTVWYSTAGGGAYKSTDGGQTFEPRFQHQPVASIGEIALADTNENIVWVGTGEHNPVRSGSYGNGVYKSTDGGKTWAHMGLEKGYHIGRIVIHPKNPDIVYVGVVGRLYGPSNERGLYKTTDGGKNWERIHYVSDQAGVLEVQMHPNDPETLLITSYELQRSIYEVSSPVIRSGEGSGLWKTTDGGKNFRRITKGLPEGPMGRIGIDICQSNPDVVYMQTGYGGAPAESKGLFRSNDGGESWTKLNSIASGTAYYYAQCRVDPNNPEKVFTLATSLSASEDGGKTLKRAGNGVHVDHHALWIDPRDSNRVLNGNDGGFAVSSDGGYTMTAVHDAAIGTFYDVEVDNRRDYAVSGGLQDNGTWYGLHFKRGKYGPVNSDFRSIGGGDGFVVRIDPTNHNYVYYESQNGALNRRDLSAAQGTRRRGPGGAGGGRGGAARQRGGGQRGGGQRGGGQRGGQRGGQVQRLSEEELLTRYDKDKDGNLDVEELNALMAELRENRAAGNANAQQGRGAGAGGAGGGRGGAARQRGGQGGGRRGGGAQQGAAGTNTASGPTYSGFRSGPIRFSGETSDGGRNRFNWKTPFILSPHNPRIYYTAGTYVFKSSDYGNDLRCISPRITLTQEGNGATALAVSPLNPDVLYVGTEDGAVWVTRDGGANWKEIHDKLGMDYVGYIGSLEASRYAEGRCYISVDTHRSDKDVPHVYVTEDFGETWKPLMNESGIDSFGNSRCLREDTQNPNLLFLGTEFAAYASIDRGKSWTKINGDLPTVAIHDFAISDKAAELVAGTHGRSLWIMDIAWLRQLNPRMLANGSHLFRPHPAVLWNEPEGEQVAPKAGEFVGENPTFGASIYYCLTDKDVESVEIEVLSTSGKTLYTSSGPSEAGLHKVVWNLQDQSNDSEARVRPGNYVVRMVLVTSAGEQTVFRKQLVVQDDPENLRNQTDRRRVVVDLKE